MLINGIFFAGTRNRSTIIFFDSNRIILGFEIALTFPEQLYNVTFYYFYLQLEFYNGNQNVHKQHTHDEIKGNEQKN